MRGQAYISVMVRKYEMVLSAVHCVASYQSFEYYIIDNRIGRQLPASEYGVEQYTKNGGPPTLGVIVCGAKTKVNIMIRSTDK